MLRSECLKSKLEAGLVNMFFSRGFRGLQEVFLYIKTHLSKNKTIHLEKGCFLIISDVFSSLQNKDLISPNENSHTKKSVG